MLKAPLSSTKRCPLGAQWPKNAATLTLPWYMPIPPEVAGAAGNGIIVAKGSSVQFIWPSFSQDYNVYVFADKTAYDACNFARAKQVGNNTSPVTLTQGTNVTYFYSSSIRSHCVDGLKVMLVTNAPPHLSGSPSTYIVEDQVYSFQPFLLDANPGDTAHFVIANRPAWADFDSSTGLLNGTPRNIDVAGSPYENIVITVIDSVGATATLNAFSISVRNSNDPPEIYGIPPTYVLQDEAYFFEPQVIDSDVIAGVSISLSFVIENKPAWINFDNSTGIISGTPSYEDAKLSPFDNLTITVIDKHGDQGSLAPFQIIVLFGCPPGQTNTSSDVIDSAPAFECHTCPPGKHKSRYGNFECEMNVATPYACGRAEFYSSGTADQITLRGSTEDDGKCTPCPLGTIQNHSFPHNLRECRPCPPGLMFINITSQCVACVAGRFRARSSYPMGEDDGAMERFACHKCPAGYYQTDSGANHCRDCPAGQYVDPPASNATSGAILCKLCNINMYAASVGSTNCSLCMAGQSTRGILGASLCDSCPLGWIGENHGGDCLRCDAGTYRNSTKGSPTVCANCSAGKVQPLLGETCCESCRPGMFSPVSGLAKCTPCQRNTFQPSSGANVCMDCPLGWYTDVQALKGNTYNSSALFIGPTTCLRCPGGQYGVNLKYTSPLSLQSYSATRNIKHRCESCPTGYYRSGDSHNATFCNECPIGWTVNSNLGATHCAICPAGKHGSRNLSAIMNSSNHSIFSSNSSLLPPHVCVSCQAGKYEDTRGSIAKECKICANVNEEPTHDKSQCQSTKRIVIEHTIKFEGVSADKLNTLLKMRRIGNKIAEALLADDILNTGSSDEKDAAFDDDDTSSSLSLNLNPFQRLGSRKVMVTGVRKKAKDKKDTNANTNTNESPQNDGERSQNTHSSANQREHEKNSNLWLTYQIIINLVENATLIAKLKNSDKYLNRLSQAMEEETGMEPLNVMRADEPIIRSLEDALLSFADDISNQIEQLNIFEETINNLYPMAALAGLIFMSVILTALFSSWTSVYSTWKCCPRTMSQNRPATDSEEIATQSREHFVAEETKCTDEEAHAVLINKRQKSPKQIRQHVGPNSCDNETGAEKSETPAKPESKSIQHARSKNADKRVKIFPKTDVHIEATSRSAEVGHSCTPAKVLNKRDEHSNEQGYSSILLQRNHKDEEYVRARTWFQSKGSKKTLKLLSRIQSCDKLLHRNGISVILVKLGVLAPDRLLNQLHANSGPNTPQNMISQDAFLEWAGFK